MQDPGPAKHHGSHTLRVWRGMVVGHHGPDVFVELGPRMQGVIPVEDFELPPEVGDAYTFTLRGREDDELWALALERSPARATWEELEPGSLVQARAVRKVQGGVQLKIGALHAFMPKSHTGLDRGEDAGKLIGKTLTCEVIEVDQDRERVLVSRRVVERREKASAHDRRVGSLKVGQVVHGRVTRVEAYGAFVRFGHGMEGLVHVSNLSIDRVEHAGDVVEVGAQVDAKVLSIKRGGKRIALGLKQLQENPWRAFERGGYEGQIVHGRVARVVEYGAFVELARGVIGLLHRSECGLEPGRRPREILKSGDELSVRVLELDVEAERASLSLLHPDGSRLTVDEAETRGAFEELFARGERRIAGTRLGDLLRGTPGFGLDEPEVEAG